MRSKSYNLQDWQKGYQSQPNEYDYWVEDIEGDIPKKLQGTLFRNGPGLLDIHGTPIRHPFDGDGMVCAISFRDGRVHFRNRFVRTEGFVQEKRKGKMLYRGVFGTQKPGGWLKNAFDLRLKNIANTNIIYWGGKLLALWEAAEPYRLDPQNLETLGIDYLDDVLKPGDAFAAHPWVVYEFNPHGQLERRHSHRIPGFAFIHDFAITSNYCIFFQNPVRFNPLPFVFGFRGAGECVQFQPNRPTRVVVIPRTPELKDDKMKILEVSSGFIFHHGNAFETSENEICVDSICYQSLYQIKSEDSYKEVDFDALAPGQLWRFTLNLASSTIEKKMLDSRSCEFPTVNPDQVGRPNRYLFMGAAHHPTDNAPLQAISKLDLESGERQLYSFAPQGYVGEPIFVPHPHAKKEDEGWVLTLVYDALHHRSDIVILDPQDLNQSPISRIHLKHHIPYGLHGSWTSSCFV
ncbi:MAG: carotenoid oxygenase family protein [Prochloron sp. SP5CPC1]|nr:carotenoid oxygenase family protein [Candidatus Paraprochloron terpiosi SP5CPC1]